MSSAVELESIVAAWAPAPVAVTEVLATEPTVALAGMLPDALGVPVGGAVPPLWHWLYFHPWPTIDELGPDGHPATGPFLPPVPDRTRMFAGGRLDVIAPLLVGRPATQTSSLVGTTVKDGRSGPLLFVTVRNEVVQAGAVCVVEEQDLVYRSGARRRSTEPEAPTATEREAPTVTEPAEARSVVAARRSLATPPPVLFRFSALTANSHRIHYDETYAREVEGYPGLVVHGPLLAVLMIGLSDLLAPTRAVAGFEFRLLAPAFGGSVVTVDGVPDATPGTATVAASVAGVRRATASIRFA
ncbi:MAG: hypothetical protein ABW328_02005 [Ilumatobacteraceae bacterium]